MTFGNKKEIESYSFPTSAANIKDNNNIYYTKTSGLCVISCSFNDSDWSQCYIILNGIKMAHFRAGYNKLKNKNDIICFPVKKNWKIEVKFYENFNIFSLDLKII